ISFGCNLFWDTSGISRCLRTGRRLHTGRTSINPCVVWIPVFHILLLLFQRFHIHRPCAIRFRCAQHQ
ncbi:unnamed protein product, partial [Prunus brigantina]